VTITNANAFTGPSSVQQGVLQISDPNALGTNSITVGNFLPGDTMLALSGNISLTNPIILSGKTGAVVPSPAGLDNTSDTNTVNGTITLLGSTCFGVGSEAGKLVIAGAIVNSSSAAPPGAQFFLRGVGDGEFKSAVNQGGGATLNVEKRESGTWTFSNTNTYNGSTKIVEGKVVVSGALLGSGYVQTTYGSVLAGSGRIGVPVTNSGTIFPGDDGVIGTLTISNALKLVLGDSTVAVDVSSGGNDQIRGLSQVTYGGTLNVVLAGSLTGNCVFKLFDATNYSGFFEGVTLPEIGPVLGWDTNYLTIDGTLHVTNGPVVTPVISKIVTNLNGGFTLSGTGTLVAPYSILATTNIALPLSSWTSVGSGVFSNGVFSFTDASATNYPQRFYLLSTPKP